MTISTRNPDALQSHQPPKSQYGKALKIILGILVVIVIAIAAALYFTRGIADIARDQLQAIRAGDMQKAYSMTSKAFQQVTSFDDFKVFVDKYDVLKNNKDATFAERKVENREGYLKGTLEAKDGSRTGVEYLLVKEDDQWKIQAIRLAPAGALTDGASEKTVTDSGGGAVHAILINDVADKEGYVESVKSTIPSSTQKIFATAQLVIPTKGIDIEASLTHLPTGGKIGPIKSTISQTGDLLKAFSFTRGPDVWPVGKYEVTVSLSTGAKKTIKFEVK